MPVYVMRDGALVEKRLAKTRAYTRSPQVLSDLAPFMTEDGTPITSRSALRAYERMHGVRQVGTDWSGSRPPPFWEHHLAREKARTSHNRS
ncbi:MAG: hypothetical protein IT536_13900 [Hyphomicrobiales bacterium]|nr:hypothetical protein [Hyphomicrobiales bacterium]